MDSNMFQLPARRPFTFDRVVRIIISCIFLYMALWLINRLSAVLLPFLIAWLIAYILEPFVQRNRKFLHTRGRFWAITLTLFEVMMLGVLLSVAFLPSIFDEMHQVASMIRTYVGASSDIRFIPPEVHDFILRHLDFERISQMLTQQNIESLLEVSMSFLSGGYSLIMSVVDVFLILLYVIFIMIDYEKLIRGFRHVVPPRYKQLVFTVFDDVKDSMNHYFRGQAFIAFIVGVLFSVGFLIVGLPLAVVLGLFIGLLNMVPYLQLISLPVTTMLCIVCSVQEGMAFWPLWWACMGVYVVVQCIQDLFLTPKVMGKAMGLNPAIILLSLSVWGSLLGMVGMIIALPLTTLLLSYYNQYLIYSNPGETQGERKDQERLFRDITGIK